MSDLSGTAAVGIETVEWLDAGGGNLTVRVTGRWRRRRPASTGQVMLVIESDGRRHRFPAMPEPPSLGGAGPGMWRLSFSVPGWLAPGLGGQAWLSLGTVTVPLPAPGAAGPERDRASAEPLRVEPPSAEPHHDEPPSAAEVPSAAPPPGPEPELRVEELERRLAEAQADRDQLTASLAEGERTRRIAEQRAHAEQALRRDLARQLASREREAQRAREAMGDLAAAEDRIRTLERRLRDARRRGDEAEQLVAAARARSQRAPRPPAQPVSAREAEAARMRLERLLRVRQAQIGERVPAEPSLRSALTVTLAPASSDAQAVEPDPGEAAPEPPTGELEAPLAGPEPPPAASPGLVDTLRRELDARAAGDAALRTRLVAAETRLATRVLLDQRTTETLHRLRDELDGLRTALQRERARRRAAEARAAKLEREAGGREQAERRAARLERELAGQRERSRDAYDAIGELRGALERLSDAPPGASPPPGRQAAGEAAGAASEAGPASGAGPVPVDRLSDALARLRESVTPPDAPPEPTLVSLTTGGRTLDAAFRRLVKRDAGAAGELLLDLLALQRAAFPHPIAYDLVLGPGRGCVRVTVGEGPPSVELHGAARTREEVDFRVKGEPARIARLLTAHGIWRRLGPRVARVRGRRDGLAALRALLSLPLDLGTLQAAGVRLRPAAALALVAAIVDPAWTAGERFVIGHRDPEGQIVYLAVRDGRPLQLARTAPAGRVATTIAGPAEALVTVLTGGEAVEAEISGDQGPLTSLRTWVKHAQSG